MAQRKKTRKFYFRTDAKTGRIRLYTSSGKLMTTVADFHCAESFLTGYTGSETGFYLAPKRQASASSVNR